MTIKISHNDVLFGAIFPPENTEVKTEVIDGVVVTSFVAFGPSGWSGGLGPKLDKPRNIQIVGIEREPKHFKHITGIKVAEEGEE